jgi:hypothetical protein
MQGNAATAFARAAGKPVSFMLAALSIVVWFQIRLGLPAAQCDFSLIGK